jgi:hypothetical protein
MLVKQKILSWIKLDIPESNVRINTIDTDICSIFPAWELAGSKYSREKINDDQARLSYSFLMR